MRTSREVKTERFVTHIPNNVRDKVSDDCGGCGGDVALVAATVMRRAGSYSLQTSVPGYACKDMGNTDDLMCGGIFFPEGTNAAVNRSAARFMRDIGERQLAIGFRGARRRFIPPAPEPVILQKAS